MGRMSNKECADRIRNLIWLIDRINLVETLGQEYELLEILKYSKESIILSFINMHAINIAYNNMSFLSHLGRSDYLLRDGVGLELGMKSLLRSPGRNMNGSDLIPKLLSHLGRRRIAVFGTSEPWLGRSLDKIADEGGGEIVAALDGFQSMQKYIEVVKLSHPEVVLLGMGMPRQEEVAAALVTLPALKNLLIINGGAIVDLYSGKVRRAPLMVRALRIEWLFRMSLEPRRLAGRYLLGCIRYVFRILLMLIILQIDRLSSGVTYPQLQKEKRK